MKSFNKSKIMLQKKNVPLFNLAFRPFFLGAGIFSIISMFLWSMIYLFQVSPPIYLISDSQWHAHEMVYGYAIAVIAGFLLTAIKNWTGIQTIYGKPLILLFVLWAIPRLLFLFGTSYLFIAGVLDITFSWLLVIFISLPILKAGQLKRQFVILSEVVLIIVCNISFYLEILGFLDNGITLGLYGGIYLIIALILTIGSKVVPFFIERGTNHQVKLSKLKALNALNLLLFLGFFVSNLFIVNPDTSHYFALGLFFVNCAKLIDWYTAEIWKNSLLWSLYLALCFICIGFLLFFGTYFGISKILAIHAFSFAIGIITLSMMSRVALAHTGRSVMKPHKAISFALGVILIGGIVRVIAPLFNIFNYEVLIALSQTLWVISFFTFIVIYFPILINSGIDGNSGRIIMIKGKNQ